MLAGAWSGLREAAPASGRRLIKNIVVNGQEHENCRIIRICMRVQDVVRSLLTRLGRETFLRRIRCLLLKPSNLG